MTARWNGTPPADTIAVACVREGRAPVGIEVLLEVAQGSILLLGSGAQSVADEVATRSAATRVWWADVPVHSAGTLARALAPLLADVPLVLTTTTPDDRDLAPRLAALLDRPLVARAIDAQLQRSADHVMVECQVARLDDRVAYPVRTTGPAVATLITTTAPASGPATERAVPAECIALTLEVAAHARVGREVELLELTAPDPATMDLGDATRVVAGGAGLVVGEDDTQARATFDQLAAVATMIGASTGATRVATDAGWIPYDRQIGTTGVTVDPELYVALGISGATQHTGGLGAPRHVVSVNVDPSCPMTAMADLGLVTDARAFLDELGRRLSNDASPDGRTNHEGANHD